MSRSLTEKNILSDLWLSFIDGNNNAFSEIYKLSYKNLYTYGLSFKIHEEQVRDIIQDLFIKLYTNPKLVKDTSTIKPFLLKAMRNSCLNILKAEQRLLNMNSIECFEIKYSIKEDLIENKEKEDHIKSVIDRILSQITPRQREIIYLRFLHQMEYEEIARIMNLSEQSARNLTHRAIEKIRKDNSDYEFLLFVIFVVIQ
ncbi:sigma-70 family RNA polymerase sigma factor [Dysgonomonas sp. OttesenSCG-928-M03]|nr:sigma-70 family RNA polymerase sigma factor [Dysgonomonas sp. OttesenSCG-928-M03]